MIYLILRDYTDRFVDKAESDEEYSDDGLPVDCRCEPAITGNGDSIEQTNELHTHTQNGSEQPSLSSSLETTIPSNVLVPSSSTENTSVTEAEIALNNAPESLPIAALSAVKRCHPDSPTKQPTAYSNGSEGSAENNVKRLRVDQVTTHPATEVGN